MEKLFYIEINNPPNTYKFEFQHMIIGVSGTGTFHDLIYDAHGALHFDASNISINAVKIKAPI